MAEPITIEQAKAQCRVLDDSEDALIDSYIAAARQWVENFTGHILVQREIVEQRDSFGSRIDIARGPIVADSVSVSYIDADGAPQDYADFVAFTDRSPARVFPARGGSWPALGQYGGVTITYTAGYDAGDEPKPLLQAMLVLIAHWYANRTASVDSRVADVPFSVDSLCQPYRSAL